MKFLTSIPAAAALVALSGAAWAHGNEAPRLTELQAVAHQVEEAAEHMSREAAENSYVRYGEGMRALSDLNGLTGAARQLHRELERTTRYEDGAAGDLERLVSAFRVAEHSFPMLRPSVHMQRDWERLCRAMGTLIELGRRIEHSDHDRHESSYEPRPVERYEPRYEPRPEERSRYQRRRRVARVRLPGLAFGFGF